MTYFIKPPIREDNPQALYLQPECRDRASAMDQVRGAASSTVSERRPKNTHPCRMLAVFSKIHTVELRQLEKMSLLLSGPAV
jgi:hypothetical protein